MWKNNVFSFWKLVVGRLKKVPSLCGVYMFSLCSNWFPLRSVVLVWFKLASPTARSWLRTLSPASLMGQKQGTNLSMRNRMGHVYCAVRAIWVQSEFFYPHLKITLFLTLTLLPVLFLNLFFTLHMLVNISWRVNLKDIHQRGYFMWTFPLISAHLKAPQPVFITEEVEAVMIDCLKPEPALAPDQLLFHYLPLNLSYVLCLWMSAKPYTLKIHLTLLLKEIT